MVRLNAAKSSGERGSTKHVRNVAQVSMLIDVFSD